MVSKENVEKFRKLYHDKFNILVTDEEATQMANDMVNLMKILLQPEPESNTDTATEGGET